ncbi:ribonuclease HI family protein [Ornithinicoccus halotolerans]|uniref:ribonuclease HI family protein n=1 Tax=Ornithinicoccus halotolerans TaxID=1748220 RepID=UPI001295AEF9|nr:ribonuclease HI family protein [Ornithinicoccus halotolerans]
MTLRAAADGSALGNPGPAGWAWYVDESRWACGGWPHGTNNMGELTAVLDLLQQTAGLEEELLVYCDSTYVINSVTRWMPGWKRRGWRKRDGSPVLNVEILRALDAAMRGRRVRFEWVKGHAGHDLNEAADRLANAAAVSYREGRPPAPGPGFAAVAAAQRPAAGSAERPAGRERGSQRQPEQPDLFSHAEHPASEEEQVVELERSLLRGEVRADRQAVERLLHPGWQEVGASGRLWSRTEMLAQLAPLPEEVQLEVQSVERVGPDAVLLVWRSLTGSGRRAAVRSSLWVRTPGGWQQRFHQGTPEG